MSDRLSCQVCDKPKLELHRVNSKIVADWSLNICKTCMDNRFEPRFLIILAARRFGAELVKKYIQKQLYVGAPILAAEIT